MALTTSSTSPDPKKPDKPAADPKKPAERADKTVVPVSAPGASDPMVLQLLAEQSTAVSNGDNDAIAAINEKLIDLGYE